MTDNRDGLCIQLWVCGTTEAIPIWMELDCKRTTLAAAAPHSRQGRQHAQAACPVAALMMLQLMQQPAADTVSPAKLPDSQPMSVF